MKRSRQVTDATQAPLSASDSSVAARELERVERLVLHKLASLSDEGRLHRVTYARCCPDHAPSATPDHLSTGTAVWHWSSAKTWRDLSDGSEGVEARTDTHENVLRKALGQERYPAVLKAWFARMLRGGPRHVLGSALHVAELQSSQRLSFTALFPENEDYFLQQPENGDALSLTHDLVTRSPEGAPRPGVLQGAFFFGVPDEEAVQIWTVPSDVPLTLPEVQARQMQVQMQMQMQQMQMQMQMQMQQMQQMQGQATPPLPPPPAAAAALPDAAAATDGDDGDDGADDALPLVRLSLSALTTAAEGELSAPNPHPHPSP